ncbi:MAG: fumarate hydratase C-terminal domain-containing protein, partial [Clostridia bacterium]|nr:fumarate hydratase C-terminal domain-containing protein [Clostridia bacterium]
MKRIQLPFTAQIIADLKAGDELLLSGIVYTARDAAHKRLCELLEQGKKLPIELTGATIYYAGPAPTPPGAVIGSIGPTTSYRMDAYAPR